MAPHLARAQIKPKKLGTLVSGVAILIILWAYPVRNILYDQFISSTVKLKSHTNAIVYLYREKDFSQLMGSLDSLWWYFNYNFQYPVFIFYENNLQWYHKLLIRIVSRNRATFYQVVIVPPSNFTVKNVVTWPHSFPGYGNMISFWLDHVFNHWAIEGLQYFIRFDCDSKIMETIDIDLFKFSETNNVKYGYIKAKLDSPEMTKNLWNWTRAFVKQHNIKDQVDSNEFKFGKPDDFYPMYYNNFEIVHVPTFRENRCIQQFVKEVVASKNIYRYRWGDAVLRYAETHLCLNASDDVSKFSFSYYHQGYV